MHLEWIIVLCSTDDIEVKMTAMYCSKMSFDLFDVWSMYAFYNLMRFLNNYSDIM